jgi:hypothetical protein
VVLGKSLGTHLEVGDYFGNFMRTDKKQKNPLLPCPCPHPKNLKGKH